MSDGEFSKADNMEMASKEEEDNWCKRIYGKGEIKKQLTIVVSCLC